MTEPNSFLLGATIGNAAILTGWLLVKWRQRWLARQREAHELIQSARRGSDLPDLRPSDLGIQHWSDICRTCHHERADHFSGRCWRREGTAPLCTCTRFEPTP